MSCDVCVVTERLENELCYDYNYELCSFSNLTSQLILQPFRRFTYVTAHSPTLPLLHLRHSSFSNPSFASPTSQALHLLLILEPFRHFTYVTPHSPTLPSLYLSHSSFSNPSVASPTSQPILQPFFRFSYVTSSSLTSPGEPPMPMVLSVLNTNMYSDFLYDVRCFCNFHSTRSLPWFGIHTTLSMQ